MTGLFLYISIASISVVYAVLRLFHDRHLSGGSWKRSEWWEALFFSLVIPGVAISFDSIVVWGLLSLTFGFWFWLVFDWVCGIYWGNSPFYLGQYDTWQKKIFINGFWLSFFKIILLIIVSGIYFQVVK